MIDSDPGHRFPGIAYTGWELVTLALDLHGDHVPAFLHSEQILVDALVEQACA